MELFHSLNLYMIEQDITSLEQLIDLLQAQTRGRYRVLPYKHAENLSGEENEKSMIMVKKNSRHGLLMTLEPYQEERKCAFIYTIPCTPNTILDWFIRKVKFFDTLLAYIFLETSGKIHKDIREILLTQLNARCIDTSYGV